MNQHLELNQAQINHELEELWALVDEQPEYVTKQLKQLETKDINAESRSSCHMGEHKKVWGHAANFNSGAESV